MEKHEKQSGDVWNMTPVEDLYVKYIEAEDAYESAPTAKVSHIFTFFI